jgi:hypothetical protein
LSRIEISTSATTAAAAKTTAAAAAATTAAAALCHDNIRPEDEYSRTTSGYQSFFESIHTRYSIKVNLFGHAPLRTEFI